VRSLVGIAFSNLLQAKRRTTLLGLALALVTTLLVLLLALSAGLSDTMRDVALTFAAGHINVAGFFKAKAGDASPIVVNAPPVRKIIEEETPDLDYVIDRHRGYARIASDRGSIQSTLSGLDLPQERKLFSVLKLAEEREYKDQGRAQAFGDFKRLAEPRSVLIFASQAKRLGVDIGDKLTVTNETFAGSRNAADVTVVAIARDVGILSNFVAFVSRQLILDLYKVRPESTGAEMIYLKDPARAPEALAALRGALEKKGFPVMEYDPEPFFMKFENVAGEDWFGQKLDLTLWNDEVVFFAWILTTLNAVSVFLVAILTMIIGVGVMNSMWIAVRERTQEIGTLRAIGMDESQVLLLFLLEAMMLGFFASVVGCALGGLVATLVDRAQIPVPAEGLRTILMSDVLHLSISPVVIVAVVLAFTLVTGLAALWPALRAARLEPVVAMQRVL
jgi:putative ABC transport system permease protein